VSNPARHSPTRHRAVSPRVYRRRRIILAVAGVLVLALVAVIGVVVYTYADLSSGIHRSALTLPTVSATPTPGVPQDTGATNILVMGLDSRLDENGNPLPAAVYNALAAGNGSDGGYNTNVLMLIHIPAGGGHAVGISIPRDDYVSFPNAANDGMPNGKIKEAYGSELAGTEYHLLHTTNMTRAEAYQAARAAARQEEVATVSQFLGGVQIDHFIEVTMAAFYEIAVAVQPIEVCLNEATSDPYSGANFSAGHQNLSASQAVSFVRQRRDSKNLALDFTDLDRERRQQAFIISLAYKLKQSGTLTNFGTMENLINTAKQDIALDSTFNLISFAADAQRFAGGGITFTTLPITGFATIGGKDVNTVNLTQIQSVTAGLIAASDASATVKATKPPSGSKSNSPAASPTATPTGNSNVATQWETPVTSGSIPCVK
jgi:LCP family protein required for cell wall assembly